MFEKIVQKYFEMTTCNFCNKTGHVTNDCPTLKTWVCPRCKCKGHTGSRCTKTDAEIHFPALAPGKAVPTPLLKSSKKTLPKNPSKPLSSKPPNRYQSGVECRVTFWIQRAKMIFGSMWFRAYKSIPMKNYKDKFLEDVQNEVSDEATTLLFKDKLEEEDAYFRAEFENAQREEKERKEQEALKKSMSDEAWERFRDEEDELELDYFDYFPCYPSEERKQFARNLQKQAEWSEFLAKEEKSQEEFRERQVVNSYKGRPRNSLTLGNFM